MKELRVSAARRNKRLRKSGVNVNTPRPREGMLSELNAIGMTVKSQGARIIAFPDGRLGSPNPTRRMDSGRRPAAQGHRAALLKTHPQVEKYYAAPDNQGGGGATNRQTRNSCYWAPRRFFSSSTQLSADDHAQVAATCCVRIILNHKEPLAIRRHVMARQSPKPASLCKRFVVFVEEFCRHLHSFAESRC